MKFEQRDITILNKVLKKYGPMNEYELLELLDEFMEDKNVGSFWEGVFDSLNNCDSIRLLTGENGFSSIDEIMRTLHYDNGKPLTTDEYNYFDHYDRSQEYWDFFGGEEIDHFELEGDELVEVVKLTYKQVRNILTNWYDGSSWEHDFGDSWSVKKD